MDHQDNSFGTSSVLLGIASITLSILSPIVLSALVFGILGLIFSHKQKKHSNNKWAKAGKILGIIGIILSILAIIINAWLFSNPNLLNNLLTQNA